MLAIENRVKMRIITVIYTYIKHYSNDLIYIASQNMFIYDLITCYVYQVLITRVI